MKCSKCEQEKNNDFPPSDLKQCSGWCRECRKEARRRQLGGVKSPRDKDVDGKRKCCKCEKTKILEDFAKDKKCLAGRARKCKICTNEDCWSKKNPIQNKEYKDKWYEENKDAIRAAWKETYKADPLKYITYQKIYLSDPINLAKVKIRNAQYLKDHPEISCANRHKRREMAIKNGNNTLTWRQMQEIKVENPTCKACGSSEDISVDHILPLERGGQNCKENCTVLCRSCNSSKHAKTYTEWRDWLILTGRELPPLLNSFVESLKCQK